MICNCCPHHSAKTYCCCQHWKCILRFTFFYLLMTLSCLAGLLRFCRIVVGHSPERSSARGSWNEKSRWHKTCLREWRPLVSGLDLPCHLRFIRIYKNLHCSLLHFLWRFWVFVQKCSPAYYCFAENRLKCYSRDARTQFSFGSTYVFDRILFHTLRS